MSEIFSDEVHGNFPSQDELSARLKSIANCINNDENILDENGQQRLYRGSNMHVICGGKKYLIANNWFGDPPENGNGIHSNKRAFYNWITLQIKAVLKNR